MEENIPFTETGIQVALIFVFKDELKTHIGFYLPHFSPAPSFSPFIHSRI